MVEKSCCEISIVHPGTITFITVIVLIHFVIHGK